MKKTSKKEILQHRVPLCVLVVRKNDKLKFWQTFQDNSSQKALSSINMYRFQAKRSRCDNSRGIVCDHVPIFGIGAPWYGKQCYRTDFFKLFL